MENSYIPAVNNYIDWLGNMAIFDAESISGIIDSNYVLVPALDDRDSGLSDEQVLQTYTSNISLGSHIVSLGRGGASNFVYIDNYLNNALSSSIVSALGVPPRASALFRTTNNLFESTADSIQNIELSQVRSQESFARDIRVDGINEGQNIILGGLAEVGVAAEENSIILYIDETNDGVADTRISIDGDYDLGLLQLELNDLGLQISYGDPLPLGDNVIIGTEADETIVGTDGNDVIRGFAGDNNLIGGAGDDVIFGGFGNDTLEGTSGNNHLIVNSESNVLIGGDGNDILEARSTELNILEGGSGNDVLIGAFGPTQYVFDAGWGNDIIIEFALKKSQHSDFVHEMCVLCRH